MIDFDALFTKYILEWHKENADKFTPDQIEEKAADIFEMWATAPEKSLNGLSPRAFFGAMHTTELIDELNRCVTERVSPPSLLLDEISQREDAQAPLLKIVRSRNDIELTMTAVNLLNEQQSDELFSAIFGWLFDGAVDTELRELAAEIIAQVPELFIEDTLRAVKTADNLGKTYAADILVNFEGDDRVYNLLVELFKTGDNIPLFASYLGKYGNTDAINVLTEYLPQCNYMEYLEICNAIERLGGTVVFDKDWSNDYYYTALKGVK